MQNFYINTQVIYNKIYSKEIINGKRITKKVDFKPTLFIPSKKETKFKTIDGRSLEPIKTESMKDAREFVNSYKGVDGFEIFGNTQYQYAYITETFPQEVIEYDFTKVHFFTMDIETEVEKGFPKVNNPVERVNVITLRDVHKDKYYVFGLGTYTPKKSNVQYFHCEDEEELLRTFLSTWKKCDPDIISGWHIAIFDIPYIIARIKMVLGEDEVNRLSPFNKVNSTQVEYWGQTHQTYDILGVAIIDYMRIYRKYVNEPREAYTLENISQVELKKGKLDWHEKFESFAEFYTKDWETFVDYNIQDTELIELLENELKLIELTMVMAYHAKVNYEDVASQVRTWDTIIYNYLHRENIQIPGKEGGSKDKFKGGHVKEPKVGLFRWVVGLDVRSLYPSIIMALNIGDETKQTFKWLDYSTENILGKSKSFQNAFLKAQEENCSLSARGNYYSRSQVSFYSKMIQKMFNSRIEYRRLLKVAKESGDKEGARKYDLMQKAVKIAMNSLFGAMGNEWFRYFDVENAESITLTGQFLIQYVAIKMNEYLNSLLKTENKDFIIASDTDSIYLNMELLVKETCPTKTNEQIVNFLDKICKSYIEPKLDDIFTDINKNFLNAVGDHLKMVRESIADQGIWTSKKRYILNVWDSEGEKFGYKNGNPTCKDCKTGQACDSHLTPKLKVMGMEIAKATNPKFCRDSMKKAVRMIIAGDNNVLLDYIENVRVEFEKMSPDEIAFPKSVNGLTEYKSPHGVYIKGTPINTKGSLLYNDYLVKKNLFKKYEFIDEGDKIKYVYLKLPNPLKDKVIAFPSKLPKEFGLEKHIDWDLQFQKTFLDPLEIILNAIGWKSQRVGSLDAWF